MKEIIVAYLAKKLDDGNMGLVFKKDQVGKVEGLTELGKQVVNTTVKLAAAKRNDDEITSNGGNTNDVCDYVTFGGNMGILVNFSDRVSMSDAGLLARNFVAKSTVSFECDKQYFVTPAVHKDNLEYLNAKFKKDNRKFQTVKVEKGSYVITKFNELYLDENTFVDVSVGSGNDNVKREVIFLRKISFVDSALNNFYTTSVNYADKEEYTNWLRGGNNNAE